MVEGLIVAAGKSERTGSCYKMALKIGRQTVIEKAIASMLPFCTKITVITGYNSSFITEQMKKCDQVNLVHNQYYEEGMFSSVKLGLKQIKSSRCLFLPGDYPFISESVFQALLFNDAEIVIPTYNGKPGHPILLRHSVIEKILSQDWQSLREFISTQQPSIIEVDCPGILMDIDTIDDYQEALTYGLNY